MSAGLLTNKVTIIKMINRKRNTKKGSTIIYAYLHNSNNCFRSRIRAYVYFGKGSF